MRAALARFIDISLDAMDVDAVARFWGGALDLHPCPTDGGGLRLEGADPRHALWIHPVPEREAGRIHLDLHADGIGALLGLGARLVDGASYPWVVLEGPEDAEVCVFPREDPRQRLLYAVVFDTTDPARIAPWWADVLGTTSEVAEDDGYSWVEPIPGAPFESLMFTRVDEATPRAHRLRLRVGTHDLGGLIAAGATLAGGAVRREGWQLLLDPDGNEFFVVEMAAPVVRGDDE